MEDILKRVYKVTEVRDNVWEELQKRDLVVVKLMAIEKFSKKKLDLIPYGHLLCYIANFPRSNFFLNMSLAGGRIAKKFQFLYFINSTFTYPT